MLVDTERKRIDTVSMRASREGGKFSPDGRWLAWVSEETGESEIYVASFPGLRGRQQVSIHGGRFPQWSARSGELVCGCRGRTALPPNATATSGSAGLDEWLSRPADVS